MITVTIGKTHLLVDGSYFIFFRYYATYNWFRLQKHTESVDDIMANNIFVTKYAKMFEKTLVELVHTHGVDWKNVIVFKDCPRESVFRCNIFQEYKQARPDKDTFNAGVFGYTYSTLLPQLQSKYGLQVFGESNLEADDVIAIVKDKIRHNDKDSNIVIITNDNDYIQLYDDNTKVINLKGVNLRDRAPISVEHYLLYKILVGDKSDCIPPIQKKMGPKTALKLASDDTALQKYLEKHSEARERFHMNSLLIDMRNIPMHLRELVNGQISVVAI